MAKKVAELDAEVSQYKAEKIARFATLEKNVESFRLEANQQHEELKKMIYASDQRYEELKKLIYSLMEKPASPRKPPIKTTIYGPRYDEYGFEMPQYFEAPDSNNYGWGEDEDEQQQYTRFNKHQPKFQQPIPIMQQQMLPRGGIVYGYPLGISQPIPTEIGALASALANASPTEQRTMLGENLYPLVEQLEAEAAPKVTGMLLEMHQTEVLYLLESPDALKEKVAEAMEVLRNVSQQQQQAGGGPDEKLAALSLNDGIVS